jgi:hypothetical protein
MIPPRIFPPGVLQLFEVSANGEKVLLQELPTSSRNRERMQNIRHDMLLVHPTKQLTISENNAWQTLT